MHLMSPHSSGSRVDDTRTVSVCLPVLCSRNNEKRSSSLFRTKVGVLQLKSLWNEHPFLWNFFNDQRIKVPQDLSQGC